MLLNYGVGEDSWESLGCKEIQPVHPKRNQSWIFIGRTDTEAETPILWPSDVKNWLTGKDPDAGKDWRWEKGMTEDETVGWHHLPKWVWVNSGSWWWTEKPGVLQSMGSERVGYGWMTELTEAPLSMGFSRQEHWRGLPFPTPIIFHLLSNTLGIMVSYSLGYFSGFILITCLLQWVGLDLFLVSHNQPFSMGKRTQNTDILTNVLKYNSFLNFLSSLLENHLEYFFFFFESPLWDCKSKFVLCFW